MNRLQDKVIVATGSASGLGRGIAKACASEGAKLLISDIHEQPLAGGFEDDASPTTAETFQSRVVTPSSSSSTLMSRKYRCMSAPSRLRGAAGFKQLIDAAACQGRHVSDPDAR
jgi:NAD(P)-dependent dehydrogenase (short-subunit alcohol dehydrogenase family)